MPRKGRLHISGGHYHVIGRGMERRHIFKEDTDKQDFLNRLGVSLKKGQAECFAWALMSNHYHLLIRVGTTPLSKTMSPLLTGYAIKYNRRHNRSGYVFQSRFKSILCEEDEYLLPLVRYIHLNPWKAGLVHDLAALDVYPWTGHAGILGNAKKDWHKVDVVLGLFSTKLNKSRKQYHRYVANGMNKREKIDLSGGGLVRSYDGWESVGRMRAEHEARVGDERILGNPDFVESALREDSLNLERKTEYEQAGLDLQHLSKAICDHYSIEEYMLLARGRSNNISIARQLFAYLAIAELGVKPIELEVQLGVRQSTVSRMVQRGREFSEKQQIDLSKFIQKS